MFVNCFNCGKEFDKKPSLVKKSNHHFCCMECQHKWRTGKTGTTKSKGKNINCEVCNKEFYVYPSELGTKRFCSRKCKGIKHAEERTVRVSVFCDNCSAPLERQPTKVMPHNFCDALCMGAFYSKQGTETYTCYHCAKMFERNPSNVRTELTFCSMRCRDNYNFDPDDENWNKIRARILERDNYTCQECGIKSDRKLHVHHKIPKRFFNETMKAHFEVNLITLCEECHNKQESHNWKSVPKKFMHLV